MKKTVDISLEKLLELVAQLRAHQVTEANQDLAADCLETFCGLAREIKSKNATIRKLQKALFGDPGEQSSKIIPKESGKPGREKDKTAKGHGKRSMKNFPGAKEFHPHPELRAGGNCPECPGKLYSLDPVTLLRITGRPPLEETAHQLERLRCSTCLKIFNTPVPVEVGTERSTPEANAIVALEHYKNGVPFYRQTQFHECLGIKLPTSTQFEMAEHVFDAAMPVHQVFELMGANARLVFIDDTKTKLLSLVKENNKNPGMKRPGMFTTGIIAMSEGHELALFYSGRNYAGENLDRLLKNRAAGQPLLEQMSDALLNNYPKEFKTILMNCLVHGRRYFVDALSAFPVECRVVIEKFAIVFQNEAHCKAHNLAPLDRMVFHQKKSTEPLEDIRRYGEELLVSRKIEMNDSLGKAFAYLNNHWQKLTAFLRIPGAPLENNIVERLLKTAIVLRKNSLFYKTEFGARVGDVLMSVIQTTIKAGANPFEYLVALQKNHAAVFKNPSAWLPWNYRASVSLAA